MCNNLITHVVLILLHHEMLKNVKCVNLSSWVLHRYSIVKPPLVHGNAPNQNMMRKFWKIGLSIFSYKFKHKMI